MNHYTIRKNFTAIFSDSVKTIRGKLAFKTKETHWLDTEAPVIISISIYSAIHGELDGDLKMNALISIIRNHVKNNVTILFTENAHLQVESLKWQSQKEAYEACMKQAHLLYKRYQIYFENCNVAYWNSYICQDQSYQSAHERLRNLYQTDPIFQKRLYEDAKKTYTSDRAQEYPDQNLYIERSITDILEQCASLLVLANKGYQFYFYPGKSYSSIDYANQCLMTKGNKISWIYVFLSIEKKTILKRSISEAV